MLLNKIIKIPTSTKNTVINPNVDAVKTPSKKRNVPERRWHLEEEVFTSPSFLLTWGKHRAAPAGRAALAGHHQRLLDTPAARDDDGDDRPLTSFLSSPPPLSLSVSRMDSWSLSVGPRVSSEILPRGFLNGHTAMHTPKRARFLRPASNGR